MTRYFIYAKDYSASTDGVQFYHENGLKTLEQFKSDINNMNAKGFKSEQLQCKTVYLHWGHKCTEEDENTIVTSYKCKKATGNDTLPETIIQWIQTNISVDAKIELLYIITDGLINSRSMDRCLMLNDSMQYENVVFHAFHRNLNQIDLSVAASFLKSRCTIYRNYELLDDTDISEEFDYDKIRIDNFNSEKNNLKSYIKLKFINKIKNDAHALQEIDKLKKLRNRLFVELTSKLENKEINLNTKDRNLFLRDFVNTDWYRNLNGSAHDEKVEIEKSISVLINYIVSDKKSYSFDALKFDTKFETPVEEEQMVDVNFTAEQEIQFPDIILDDDKGIPVVLLTEFNLLDKIIFHKTSDVVLSPASFNKFKSAMDCPLFLLNDPDISGSIGYFYTLNVYKQLLKNTNKTEPRTRRPFHGGLVLLDTDQFDKYNDYILSATYFGFKKINYNKGLFYYVLLKNCENKEWMDKNVVEQLKKYVMRRISTTICKIGLSSLPLDPQENTSLLTALWYCVEMSSQIFKNDSLNFTQERLRMHYGVANSMIEILNYFNYDLDKDAIEKRVDLIKHVMILKRIQPHEEKVYFLLKNIFKNEKGFLVYEIDNPTNLRKLNYLKLNHKGMLRDDVIKEDVRLDDFVHTMHTVDESVFDSIKICDKTLRPFFTIDKNKSSYSELVRVTKQIIINNDNNKIKIDFKAIDSLEFDKILSLFNLFINYVQDFEKYPNLEEYVEYIIKKKKFNGNKVTIFPSNTFSHIENVYSIYRNATTNTEIHNFIKVSKRYVKRLERIKAEDVINFNNENEINEFISNEERKINLIKR